MLRALLQERGKESVGSGNAIAVQNLGENTAMLLMLGSLSGAFGATVSYFFGTTANSARKNEDLSWEKWADRLSTYYRTLEKLFSPDLFVVGYPPDRHLIRHVFRGRNAATEEVIARVQRLEEQLAQARDSAERSAPSSIRSSTGRPLTKTNCCTDDPRE